MLNSMTYFKRERASNCLFVFHMSNLSYIYTTLQTMLLNKFERLQLIRAIDQMDYDKLDRKKFRMSVALFVGVMRLMFLLSIVLLLIHVVCQLVVINDIII